MRAAATTSLATVLGVLLCTGAPRAAVGPPVTYAYVNGHWFDGRRFVARPFYSVHGELHPNRPWAIDSTIDLRGGYVVPPFGEAHNHNAGLAGAAAAATTARYLREGIFYVKNPGNLPAQRAARESTGIDVVYSNGLLTAPDGHPLGLVRRNVARGVMTEADGEGSFYFTVETRADVDRKWPALLASRPDFIKTVLLYSEEYERRRADTTYFSWKGLDPRLLPYIVRKARDAGLRVSTHVETAADFRAALAAGTSEVNHLPGFRPEGNELAGYRDLHRFAITDTDAARAARQRLVVVTTVSEVLEVLDADSSEVAWARAGEIRAMVVGNLRTLLRHGVRIALGSDRYRSTSTAEALALHRLAVADNLTLLKMWCETTPATIFPGRRIGRLRDGYEASFLVLDGNPLDDFANTGRIRMRVSQGRVLPEP